MTSGSDPIDLAIDDAARKITARAAPDLRARVAARLRPGFGGQAPNRRQPRVAWWQPALAAAAAAAVILLLWMPPAPPADPPRIHRADIALTAPPGEPAGVPPPRAAVVHSPVVRAVVEDDPVDWPEMDTTIEPLAVAALTLDPLEPVGQPLTAIEIAPLVVQPLALAPLEEPDLQRRR